MAVPRFTMRFVLDLYPHFLSAKAARKKINISNILWILFKLDFYFLETKENVKLLVCSSCNIFL